jgi:hypothetical protein
MIGWLTRKSPAPARGALLAAIPVKNALARETPVAGEGGGLRLTAPVERTWRRMLGAKAERTFELDALGTFVWQGLNNRRTVEDAIRRFADEQRVNLREAEVAVLAFLQTLTRRGLVALVAEKPPCTPKRRRK